jgi:hypothetical protein
MGTLAVTSNRSGCEEILAILEIPSTSSQPLLLLVADNVILNSPIRVTLMMEAIHSLETLVLTRATWRNIPEDSIFHSYRPENLKSYIALTGWAL